MLRPIATKRFEKDKKKARKQKKDFLLLEIISIQLIEEKLLDAKYLDHPLKGNFQGCRECHLENDWLLIYRINKKDKTIIFERLGSHSELFR